MNYKRYLLTLLSVAVFLGIPVVVFASNISSALYYGTIRVSNNGAAASGISANVSLNSQALIDYFGVDNAFDYIAIRSDAGTDVPFTPGYGSNPWIMWVPSIDAYSNIDYILYTGNASLGSTKYYFPGSDNMTTSDHASLEYGDNFTDERSCYIDTTAVGKVIFYKEGACAAYISDTGNVTFGVGGYDAGAEATNRASAQASGSTLLSVDNPADFDGYITAIEVWAATAISGLRVGTHYHVSGTDYKCRDSATIGGVDAGSKKPFTGFSIRVMPGDLMSCYFTGGSIETDATGYSGLYGLVGEYIDPGDQATYNLSSGDAMSLKGLGFKTLLSATDVDSGEYTLEIYADSTNATMELDDVVQDTAAVVSIPDNGNDWIDGDPDATPYIEYIKRYVGGTLKQHIEWEYDTTFTDLSGNGNDATPSFRTTSSDANISANLISFLPISQAVSTTTPSTSWPSMITEAPEEPSTLYTEESRPGIFFEPIVHALCSMGGIPDSFFWYNFSFFIIIAAGMLVYRIHPSLVLKGIIMLAIMIFFAMPGMNMYGMFTAIYFTMGCFGLIVLSRSYGI